MWHNQKYQNFDNQKYQNFDNKKYWDFDNQNIDTLTIKIFETLEWYKHNSKSAEEF